MSTELAWEIRVVPAEAIVAQVEQMQSDIEALSREDFIRLREWLFEKDWKEWDIEVESDSMAGKLDFLIEEAITEKSSGGLKEL